MTLWRSCSVACSIFHFLIAIFCSNSLANFKCCIKAACCGSVPLALHTYIWYLAIKRAWDTNISLGKASRPKQIDRGKCGGWSIFVFFVNQSITFLQKVCETLQSQKMCLSVSSCSLQKEQRLFDEIPILNRKSFVAILRWSSLNWKILNFEFLVA